MGCGLVGRIANTWAVDGNTLNNFSTIEIKNKHNEQKVNVRLLLGTLF